MDYTYKAKREVKLSFRGREYTLKNILYIPWISHWIEAYWHHSSCHFLEMVSFAQTSWHYVLVLQILSQHLIITLFFISYPSINHILQLRNYMAMEAQLCHGGMRASIHLYQFLYELCCHSQQHQQLLRYQTMLLFSLTFSVPFILQIWAKFPLYSEWYQRISALITQFRLNIMVFFYLVPW